MKKSFTIAVLFALSITACFSQDAGEKTVKMLVDEFGSYKASGEAESRVIDDGSTRVTRSYVSGEKTLTFKIGIPGTVEDFQKMKGEIEEVVGMFQEMAEDGKMEIELIEGDGVSGLLNFSSRGAGAFILAKDQYLIEINMRGAEGIGEIKSVYQALDLSLLN